MKKSIAVTSIALLLNAIATTPVLADTWIDIFEIDGLATMQMEVENIERRGGLAFYFVRTISMNQVTGKLSSRYTYERAYCGSFATSRVFYNDYDENYKVVGVGGEGPVELLVPGTNGERIYNIACQPIVQPRPQPQPRPARTRRRR